MDWQHLVEYCFYGLLSYAAMDITITLRKARTSIEELKIQGAQILAKADGHEKIIDEHSERILVLERQR